MSRSDPQFNLRIPEALRDRVMEAAKENSRSATSEILARLELSFLGESSADELIPATKAIEMAQLAKRSIPSVVKSRIVTAVNRAASMGHAGASVDLADLELESLALPDQDALLEIFSQMLSDAGYDYEWDGPDHVWVQFDPY